MRKQLLTKKRLNVTNKLQLHERFGDKLYLGNIEHHSVQEWILLYPVYIYRRVYGSTRYGLKPLELRPECILLLKEQLALKHPELLAKIEYRKSRHVSKSLVGINLKRYP
jgi:hypothetical protein